MEKVNQFLDKIEIEPLYAPFMLINNKLVKFTNVMLQDNATGDEFYIMLTKQGKIKILKTCVDIDCDGIFYHAWFVDILKDELQDYSVNTNFYKITNDLLILLHNANAV